jgi:ribonuclease-3 family protein
VNALQIAYLGDSVLEVYVRKHLLLHQTGSIEQLHKRTVHFTNAKSQAKFLEELLPELSEDELALVKKGRNSPASQGKKTASMMEYKYATGLETLLGQLYLDNISRLETVVQRYIEIGSNHGHSIKR